MKKNNKPITYSISKELRENNKSNDYFELMLSRLKLEEIIALKFEISYRSLGFILTGVPIWRTAEYLVKESLIKFGLSISRNQKELKDFLGISTMKAHFLLKKYNLLETNKKENV